MEENLVFTAGVMVLDGKNIFLSEIITSAKNKVIECIGGANKGFDFNDDFFVRERLSKLMKDLNYPQEYIHEYVNETLNLCAKERQMRCVYMEHTHLAIKKMILVHDQVKLGVRQYYFLIKKVEYACMGFVFELKNIFELYYIDKEILMNQRVIDPFYTISFDEMMSFDFIKRFQNNHRKGFISFLYTYVKECIKREEKIPFKISLFKKKFKEKRIL